MQMKLVVTAGATKSGEITINPPMTLGRSRDADLTLRHALISRKHCEIVESQGVIIARDLGSLNGTYVGGQRINEAALKAGDELTVGSVTFRVEMIVPDAPAAQAKAPQAATGTIPQGVDPETGLQFLEPVDAIETIPVEQVEVAQETTPQAAAAEVSAVGTLERSDDQTIQQPEAVQLELAEPAEDSVPDIPLDLGDDAVQPAAASQIDFAPAADEDAPSVVNPSDVSFEVADEQAAPDADDSALGSFLKKL